MKKTEYLRTFQTKTPKVYKSKKLNNANFGDFTHTDYQIFLQLISKIGGIDEFGKYLQFEHLQREQILSAKEYSEIFSVDLSNSYKMLAKACKKLMKTSITLEKPELLETWYINVCSMAKYNHKQGTITVNFTEHIMPYLAQVKAKFILYNLKETANFGSFYTTRLYELIQEVKETGWLLKSVRQLRDIFIVGNKLKAYKDFKQRTFAHACQEINDNYDIGLSFEEFKEGRKVVAVKFSFKPITIHKVTNQATGTTRNIYTKLRSCTVVKKKKEVVSSKISNIPEIQFPLENMKPLNNTLTSFISKIALFKKKK